MPDAFFATSKPRKRKRPTTDAPTGSAKKISRKSQLNGGPSGSKGVSGNARKKSRLRDEELDSDHTNEEDAMDIDNLELRASDEEEGSGDEDENETPAEKRLRLAKMYLESVKEGLGEWYSSIFEPDSSLICYEKRMASLMLQKLTRNLFQLD
jgi:ribosomal RNA-processing protein 9